MEKTTRPWRLTKYYIASQAEFKGSPSIPVFDVGKNEIFRATPGFFSSLSLEGTAKLTDGRIVNVTGKYVDVDPKVYEPVWRYHQKYLSKRAPGYSGLVVRGDSVVQAFAFRVIPKSEVGIGYGMDNGIARSPWRTLAADLGRTKRSEPKYKDKGGLVPVGTIVTVEELVGKELPDGTVHDGKCIVNDTGGGIFGAHFDLFVGFKKDENFVKLPKIVSVHFDGIEERVPVGYEYGLNE